MPSMSIQFSNSLGLYTILVSPPVFGYRSKIEFPFVQTRTADGKLQSYDYGSSYDIRSCECEMELDSTDQETFFNFINNSDATRQDTALRMTLQEGSGFFPFGTDKGDSGSFDVVISNPSFKGIGSAPYKFFHTRVTLVNTGTFPSYTPTTEKKDGSWTFGNISECRFPQRWYQPEINLSYDISLGNDSSADIIDNGQTADRKSTKFSFQCSQGKAERILSYIADTARDNPFTISVPDSYYPFGLNAGSNKSFFVKLSQNTINVRNPMFNRFEFDLQLDLEG